MASEKHEQEAGTLIYDNYKVVGNENILSINLISTDDIFIGIGFTLKPDAEQLGKKLVLKALESEDAYPQWPVSAAKLYFLGSYSEPLIKELKILLRKGSIAISGKKIDMFTIEYYFSRD